MKQALPEVVTHKSAPGTVAYRRRRTAMFKILSTLVIMCLLIRFGGAFAPLEPFGLRLMPDLPHYTEQSHSWHQAEWGALIAVLLAGPLVALLHQPQRKPLLMQFYATGVVVLHLLLLLAPFSRETPLFLITTGCICLLPLLFYPVPAALKPAFKLATINKPLLLLALGMIMLLAPISLEQWGLQAAHQNEDTAHHHYANNVALECMLSIGALLVSLGGRGSKALASLLGVALVYLGAAAFATIGKPDNWGTIGGWLCLVSGCMYVLASLFEERIAIAVDPSNTTINVKAVQQQVFEA